MLPEEVFRVVGFMLAVATVYVTAAWLGLRAVSRRGSSEPTFRPPFRGERGARRVVFALAGIGIACGAYGRFVEPYWLDVVHVRVDSARWLGPSALRIVHLSDMHSDPSPRLEERLPAAVRAERPDIIVFTGDTINSPSGLAVWKRCLSELARIAPTLAVRGNWDVWYWNDLDLFGGTGARELANTSAVLRVKGNQLWIGGLSVGAEGGLRQLISAARTDGLRVLLHHYPDELVRASELGVDLYLGGHTHGGQVALPGYGALVTMSKFGKRFEAGLYRVGKTWAYINRGIGMEGHGAPRVRFFARPELTVIDVRPANAK
jgi:predicted MPP superfamily phosphohydrolase